MFGTNKQLLQWVIGLAVAGVIMSWAAFYAVDHFIAPHDPFDPLTIRAALIDNGRIEPEVSGSYPAGSNAAVAIAAFAKADQVGIMNRRNQLLTNRSSIKQPTSVHRCDRVSLAPLRALKQPPETPV